jgi:hypothetical protein
MERHRCACSHPLPKTRHRQADQAAQNGQTCIARALIGTKPMPGRISREAYRGRPGRFAEPSRCLARARRHRHST